NRRGRNAMTDLEDELRRAFAEQVTTEPLMVPRSAEEVIRRGRQIRRRRRLIGTTTMSGCVLATATLIAFGWPHAQAQTGGHAAWWAGNPTTASAAPPASSATAPEPRVASAQPFDLVSGHEVRTVA